MKNFDEKWLRLATAALNARDELRVVVFDLDAALCEARGDDADLLQRLREIAARHAEALKAALKRPQ